MKIVITLITALSFLLHTTENPSQSNYTHAQKKYCWQILSDISLASSSQSVETSYSHGCCVFCFSFLADNWEGICPCTWRQALKGAQREFHSVYFISKNDCYMPNHCVQQQVLWHTLTSQIWFHSVLQTVEFETSVHSGWRQELSILTKSYSCHQSSVICS